MDSALCYFFFFFQAEDGIRDVAVTGVQTCALPISLGGRGARRKKEQCGGDEGQRANGHGVQASSRGVERSHPHKHGKAEPRKGVAATPRLRFGTSVLDRKSTRLNSSHGYISYAVFCLKKKKKIDRYRE